MTSPPDNWWLILREADQRLADAREEAHRALRDADQKALALIRESNKDHFDQLNENAKRTIEERGHFVSVESFEPFQNQVLEYMARSSGASAGSDRLLSWVVAGVMAVIAAASVAVAIYGHLFGG